MGVGMNSERAARVSECLRMSLAGEIAFPEVLSRLGALGVERYHADYSRGETTYYGIDGASLVLRMGEEEEEIGREFFREEVAGAVRQSQRGEHTYHEFVEKTMRAGCVGYFVQLTGGRVLYFGRNGECHEETFPAVVAAGVGGKSGE